MVMVVTVVGKGIIWSVWMTITLGFHGQAKNGDKQFWK